MTAEAQTTAPKSTKTVYTKVAMDDGRTVEFPGKRKLQKESFVNEEGKLQVRLDFVNGETRIFTVPDALVAKFALHGAEQKLGDEGAGLDDVEDIVLAIDELTERLEKGEWGVRREASGLAGTSVLARALVQLSGKTAGDIKAFLATKTLAEKLALRNSPQVSPIIAQLESAKVKKGSSVDTEALLGELA